MIVPPSITNSWPVEYVAFCKMNNNMAVTSSGSPIRGIGWFATIPRSRPSVIGVRMGPGWIELTRIPNTRADLQSRRC